MSSNIKESKDLNDRGIDLIRRGDREGALKYFKEAFELHPESLDAAHNTGLALMELGQFQDALPYVETAVRIVPNALTYGNLGACLYRLAQFNEAVNALQMALAEQSDNALLRYHLGHALLGIGDYDRGWEQFEWRKKTDKWVGREPLKVPSWDGLRNKRLLLFHEQGFGDTLMMLRYLPKILKMCSECHLVCPPEIASLAAFSYPDLRVVSDFSSIPLSVDCQCSLLSLPFVFQTALANMTNDLPYLWASPDRVSRWRDKLASIGGKKVGLCWASNARPNNPSVTYRQKSVPTDELSKLAVTGITYVSLQTGAAAEPVPLPLHDWSSELHDFAETAALIMNLDLIISIDSAVAHLAGALGKRVWLLNRYATDWRWVHDHNPWYPRVMRIFRQHSIDSWGNVLDEVRQALENP